MSGPRSHCDLSSGYEREKDIYRLGGMIFIVFVFLVEVEQEGEEAPSCSMCCYICTAICTACTACVPPLLRLSGTALTLVYQAKLYVVTLVTLLFYKLRAEKIYPPSFTVFLYIEKFSVLGVTSVTRSAFR